MRTDDPEAVKHAPFTLFPSLVPESCFEDAKNVQKFYDMLYHNIAHDHDFLKTCFEKYETFKSIILD